jgi:hypothetical protein
MSFNAVDYFATLGRKPGAFAPKPLPSIDPDRPHDVLTPAEVWNKAITDVAVLMEGEEMPSDEEGWEILNTSVGELELCRPYIVFRRRIHSRRIDHISKVGMITGQFYVIDEVSRHLILYQISDYANELNWAPTPA